MSLLKKSFGFIIAMAVLPATFAATARPSIVGATAARLPTMIGRVTGNTTTSGMNPTLADAECIESYTTCLRGGDACGGEFEECTNKELFFAKRPLCASTLIQCSTNGVSALFGTSAQTAFANKNTDGTYVYPTDGSVLGQLIGAAHINNRYDTSQCVRRYTDCLKKEDVCGADFELCTTPTEFTKQKLFCESTLARCQDAGKIELFGSTNTGINPSGSSRIGTMISEGAALAAVNAVSTCYKVADQCILNNCAANPYKCKEGSNRAVADIVDILDSEGNVIEQQITYTDYAINRNEISAFIKNKCFDTISANRYCYATFLGNGQMPTNSQLRNEDNKEEIYSAAYSSRMNNTMNAKIDELIEKFDKKTKQRCSDTIVQCAMRTCGGGFGSACYASAFNASNEIKGVTNPDTMEGIKYGCEAAVNNDMACKYSVATFDSATGEFSFEDKSLFDKLFIAPDDMDATNPDPVGAVATLNTRLSTSYNQAGLDRMKRQCTSVATGCVRTMCGSDFENCYRNRTDVYSTLTATGNTAFDRSMNRVGGVLDYTVILGLCLNTVKSNQVCEEHIMAEAAKRTLDESDADSWGAGKGGTNTRDAWLGAGVYNAAETVTTVQDIDENGNPLCTASSAGCGASVGVCNEGFNVGDLKCIYDAPYKISESSYKIAQAERTVFRDLVYDLEKEAQAQYNAKLTKQQNMCLSGSGGIMGSRDISGTFMWAKLRSNKVPKSYAVDGLQDNQIVASNDLYGSFCRVRVTVQSDDKAVQDRIRTGTNWSVANFAAGDAFTCGSWIPQSELEEISKVVGSAARDDATRGDSRTRNWMAVLGTVVGGVGGGIGMNALQKGGLGGLLGTTNNTDTNKTKLARCVSYVDAYVKTANGKTAQGYATSAINMADSINDTDKLISVKSAIDAAAATDLVYADEKVDTDKNPVAKQKKDAANAAMEMVKTYCQTEVEGAKSASSRTTGNLIGAGAGAIIGGVLAYQATRSIQNASADSAEAAAIDEWMNDVGKHIRCYIGSEEVGMYGDMISTEME